MTEKRASKKRHYLFGCFALLSMSCCCLLFTLDESKPNDGRLPAAILQAKPKQMNAHQSILSLGKKMVWQPEFEDKIRDCQVHLSLSKQARRDILEPNQKLLVQLRPFLDQPIHGVEAPLFHLDLDFHEILIAIGDLFALQAIEEFATQPKQALTTTLLVITWSHHIEAQARSFTDFAIGSIIKSTALDLLDDLSSKIPMTEHQSLTVIASLSKLEHKRETLKRMVVGEYQYHNQQLLNTSWSARPDSLFLGPLEVPEFLNKPYLQRLTYKPHRSLRHTRDLYSKVLDDLALSPVKIDQRAYLVSPHESSLERFTSGNMLGNKYVQQCSREVFRGLLDIHEGITESRLYLLLMSLRAYHNKYGQLPPTLNDLRSEFLESIPHDPFSNDGLVYQARRNRIYSVGSNFIDNQGRLSSDDIVCRIIK